MKPLTSLKLHFHIVDSVVVYYKDELEAIEKATDKIGCFEWMLLWVSEGIRERAELTSSISKAALLQVEREAESLPVGDKSLSNTLKRTERVEVILHENVEYMRAESELKALRFESEILRIAIQAERRMFIEKHTNFISGV
jgi:hypothetical protein